MALLPGPRPAPLSALHPALSSSAPCSPLPTCNHGPRPRLLGPPPLPPWPLAPPPRPPPHPPRPSAPPPRPPTTLPRPRPPCPGAASPAGSLSRRPSSRPCAGLRGPIGPALLPPPFLLCAAAHRPPCRARPACALPARLSAGSALRAPPCGPASSAPARRSPSAAAGRGRLSRRLSLGGPGLRRGPCTGTTRTGCERSKYNFPGPRPPRRRCHPRALTSPPESWPCPGSPPSRCPWRATLEATFVGEGNARSALSLSRWKSDARLEGELPLWKRKSGGWKASAFCLNRSRPASPVASPSGEASRPEAACKVGCVLHPGNLQRAIIGGSTLRVGGLACEAAAARWWAAETS